MKVPKWFTIANITKGPEPLKVELVDLTEQVVAAFMIDDHIYRLTVRINGRKKVIKHTSALGILRYREYMDMLSKALDGRTLYQMQQKGYKIITHDTFYDSPVRKRILHNVQMASKGTGCIY
uniref:Uncharacterized protein n=1 Tax=Pantoea phage Survivor TaxID=3232176 RepID=A0AAU8L0K6_9CAUD